VSDQPGLLGRIDRTGVPLLLCRLVIGGLFIRMGLVKAVDPAAFMHLIREYHMVPDGGWWFLNLAAALLPWVETFCGYMLIFGVGLRGTALVIIAMLAVFTPAIVLRGVGLHNTEHLAFCKIAFDCGCGAGVVNFCWKLVENAALFLGALLILLSRSQRFCLRARLVS
jgi:uncharacterized membrane protein YphA (DoxX/SURF4 family)